MRRLEFAIAFAPAGYPLGAVIGAILGAVRGRSPRTSTPPANSRSAVFARLGSLARGASDRGPSTKSCIRALKSLMASRISVDRADAT